MVVHIRGGRGTEVDSIGTDVVNTAFAEVEAVNAFAIEDTASISKIFMANKRGEKVLLEKQDGMGSSSTSKKNLKKLRQLVPETNILKI